MSATNMQQAALAASPAFQRRVASSIFKKAIAIVEDVLANANLNYTNAQKTRALAICNGQGLNSYYNVVASSTNVVASTITPTYDDNVVTSDISDASLDSQVYTIVFVDLV